MAELQLNGMGMAGTANRSDGSPTASLGGLSPWREANLVREGVDYDVVVPAAMATASAPAMECACIGAESTVTLRSGASRPASSIPSAAARPPPPPAPPP